MASKKTTDSDPAEAPVDLFSNEDAGVTPASPEAPAAPRATALLFQAPDLSALRPVKKAKPVPEQDIDDIDEDEDTASDDSGQDNATSSSDDDGDQQSTGKKRRRRGGRGRGRSGANASDDSDDSSSDDDGDDSSSSNDQRQRSPKNKDGKGNQNKPKDTDDDAEVEPADDKNADSDDDTDADEDGEQSSSTRRRRRRRRSGSGAGPAEGSGGSGDEVTALKGSTRLEAKRQRRREGRDAGRKRQIITEAEFLARRESVNREMIVRELDGRTQIAVLEDKVLVEHYVSQQQQASLAGNVYLGRVQNVLPSMEAAFVDIGKGRNAVLYAGEVNWDAAGLDGQPRRIEQALKSGDPVLVQVTKDPIGHKGARLTSQITLAGRYLVLVPGGGMTGISRKLPDNERTRLKNILRDIVPEGSGVIVRTAAEGASEEELAADIERLQGQWAKIEKKQKSASAPALLQGEPDLAIKVVRDIFNDDFAQLAIAGDKAYKEITEYLGELAPDLASKVTKWVEPKDIFSAYRVDEQLAKGMDRKVWLPSGGSLVIDRTEAMTVVDVNTGKFTGSGGTLEETVTRNNLEAAEEIVRQLRLRDIGGIIVVDFIDMVLESNRDLVLRRMVECLGRDRTKHQVAEVTSLGLVQMTRKRVGQGLVEAFSETCSHCNGRGFIVHSNPIEKSGSQRQSEAVGNSDGGSSRRSRKNRGSNNSGGNSGGSGNENDSANASAESNLPAVPVLPDPASEAREAVKATLAQIAAAAAHAHEAEDTAVESAGGSEGKRPKTLDDIVLEDRSGKDKKPEPVAEQAVEKPAEQSAEQPAPAQPAEQPQPQKKPRRRRATRPQAVPALPPPPPSDME